jgi:hypothetical protein
VSESPTPQQRQCEIELRGHLDERWSRTFPGLALTHGLDADGEPVTSLRGSVADEAELHGLLARIRDLGIPLLRVERTPHGGEAERPPRPATGGED